MNRGQPWTCGRRNVINAISLEKRKCEPFPKTQNARYPYSYMNYTHKKMKRVHNWKNTKTSYTNQETTTGQMNNPLATRTVWQMKWSLPRRRTKRIKKQSHDMSVHHEQGRLDNEDNVLTRKSPHPRASSVTHCSSLPYSWRRCCPTTFGSWSRLLSRSSGIQGCGGKRDGKKPRHGQILY